MIADLHTHTILSCDAHATMEGYLLQAEKNCVDLFCITEHVDYNPLDWGFGFYDPDGYFKKLNAFKNQYRGTVQILAGLEFSEPHEHPDELAFLSRTYSYDCIIGSIHWANNLFPAYGEAVDAKAYFEVYWKSVLKTAKCGGFDTLGHLDFPKRYYKELWYRESDIREICKYLVQNEIALEINTSALRKGLSETMPGKELLMIYRDVGGTFVTVGSDAHDDKDLAADNSVAKQLIQSLGLQEVIYIGRKQFVI